MPRTSLQTVETLTTILSLSSPPSLPLPYYVAACSPRYTHTHTTLSSFPTCSPHTLVCLCFTGLCLNDVFASRSCYKFSRSPPNGRKRKDRATDDAKIKHPFGMVLSSRGKINEQSTRIQSKVKLIVQKSTLTLRIISNEQVTLFLQILTKLKRAGDERT